MAIIAGCTAGPPARTPARADTVSGMRTVVAIMLSGALGALARYGLQALLEPRTGDLPWGTFVVNISGAFLLGLVFTVTTQRLNVEPWLRTALTVGFLGSYTTFSTLAYETVTLINGGQWVAAFLNMTGSAVFGVAAVMAGILVARVAL